MNSLTYGIYYSPNGELTDLDNVNFICSDNKIHVRLRDFNYPQIIRGFEKKLTYLITYLINYSYIPKLIGDYDNKKIIDTFSKSNDVGTILENIRSHLNANNLKGIKIKKNYNRKLNLNEFGDLDKNCFPLDIEDDIIKVGDLKTFLKKFRINLEDFLFNDNYSIVIMEKRNKEINQKFINKTNKKLNRLSANNFDVAELW